MLETIVAVATPAGAGALAILRLSGAQALPCARGFLKIAGSSFEPRRATFARAHDGCYPIDEVLATYFPGPSSATGEDLFEVSCHGSVYIVSRLLEAAANSGARLARPGEFTQRAFINGRLDLTQAEAVCDLIRARTKAAHSLALSQLEGGLSRAVNTTRTALLDLLVRLEASLDHPEEDIPTIAAAEFGANIESLSQEIESLAKTFATGRLIREGARIAIVGRPNAGKSSLLNALLGRERAIVCPTPGTTRDTLEEPAVLDGLPSILIDTAGLRCEAADPAERIGMERAELALSACDLGLLVIDGSRPVGEEDTLVHRRILMEAAKAGRKVISVLSKADLPLRATTHSTNALPVSTLQAQSLQKLVAHIAQTLAADRARAGSESALVSSTRHYDALSRAAEELELARRATQDWPGQWEDRAASRLRSSLAALDEIIGPGAPHELLDAIFSRFCLGK